MKLGERVRRWLKQPILRDVRKEDQHQIMELESILLPDGQWSPELYEYFMNSEGTLFKVLTYGEEVVAGLLMETPGDSVEKMELLWIATKQGYSSEDLVRRLWTSAQEILRAWMFKEIILRVPDGGLPWSRWYEVLELDRIGSDEDKSPYGVVMRKRLEPRPTTTVGIPPGFDGVG